MASSFCTGARFGVRKLSFLGHWRLPVAVRSCSSVRFLGVVAMSGEFAQRTATQTFLAAPRRGKAVLAKLLTCAAMGIASVSPKTGRSIQEKSGLKPVHHKTFATSSTRWSSRLGSPSRASTVLATRSIPAAARSLGLTRTSGAAWESSFGRILRPIGVSAVSTR